MPYASLYSLHIGVVTNENRSVSNPGDIHHATTSGWHRANVCLMRLYIPLVTNENRSVSNPGDVHHAISGWHRATICLMRLYIPYT